jgi:hypothetical protein
VKEKLWVKKHKKQEFKEGKFNVKNLSYVMVKQEDEINSENRCAIFKSPPPPKTDDTEINTGNIRKSMTMVQCRVKTYCSSTCYIGASRLDY